MLNFDEFAKQIKNEIKIVASVDDEPLLVLSSGGKDSTIMTLLVVEALRHCKERVYIINLIGEFEPPFVKKNCELLKRRFEPEGFKFILKNLEMTKEFFKYMIVKGWYYPNHFTPWCGKHIKIPVKKNIVKQIPFKKYRYEMMGIRQDESNRRKRIYKSKIYLNGRVINYLPIFNVTNNIVFDFLKYLGDQYNYDTSVLIDGYRNNQMLRSGCWFCYTTKPHLLNPHQLELIQAIRKIDADRNSFLKCRLTIYNLDTRKKILELVRDYMQKSNDLIFSDQEIESMKIEMEEYYKKQMERCISEGVVSA